jgi:hypothetical protein
MLTAVNDDDARLQDVLYVRIDPYFSILLRRPAFFPLDTDKKSDHFTG